MGLKIGNTWERKRKKEKIVAVTGNRSRLRVLRFNGTWFGPSSIPLCLLTKSGESSNSVLPLPPGSACIAISSVHSEHKLIHARVFIFYSGVPKSCWRC